VIQSFEASAMTDEQKRRGRGILRFVASANVELVRSILAAWERGDFSSVEWADPRIDYVHADGPSPGRWSGLAGMAEGWRDALRAWEELHIQANEYYELDDNRVVVLTQLSGHGKTSGLDLAQMHTESVGLFRIEGSKVTTIVWYWDRERGLAELGLGADKESPRR
jgi:hypothetical protein